jgi:hypothetical protein
MSLLTSLVSHWALTEASGTRADSHGTNDLADNSTVASGSGFGGNVADFELNFAEFLDHADNADLSTGDIDFTLAAWVNLESKDAFADQVIIGKASAVPVQEYMLRYDGGQDRFRWIVLDSSNSVGSVTFSATTPSTGTWYLVVAWHDAAANQIGISVNAGTAATTSWTTGVRDGAGEFALGREGGRNTDYFDGLMWGASLWKRVLTSQERTDLYNGGAGLPYASFGGGSFQAAWAFGCNTIIGGPS